MPHGPCDARRVHDVWTDAVPATWFPQVTAACLLCSSHHRIPRRFRGQFAKLLQCVQRDFVPELRRSSDADVAAVATLLDSYISDGAYRKPPDGRDMPRIDLSSMRENRA